MRKLLDNTYEYQDDSCKNIIELNDNVTLIRENAEFKLILKVNEKCALYELKEYGYNMNIEVNYFDIIKEEKALIISYQLETNDKEIKIVLEGEN